MPFSALWINKNKIEGNDKRKRAVSGSERQMEIAISNLFWLNQDNSWG